MLQKRWLKNAKPNSGAGNKFIKCRPPVKITMPKAQLGSKAPALSVAEWLQGPPVNLEQLVGQVVLIEVFQVNCPGCFLYALPQAINLFQKYSSQGLSVLGIATAFEDFDKNNLENLHRLLDQGEVAGETYKLLKQKNQLIGNQLPYRIPFPVAMDKLCRRQDKISQTEITNFIDDRVPNFQTLSESDQLTIRQRAQHYLQTLEYHAETFEIFNLKGTPSHILVDKAGLLRNCTLGAVPNLEAHIIDLLQ
jgi:hypothetical protein